DGRAVLICNSGSQDPPLRRRHAPVDKTENRVVPSNSSIITTPPMKHLGLLLGLATLVYVGSSVHAQGVRTDRSANAPEPPAARAASEYFRARLDLDLTAI